MSPGRATRLTAGTTRRRMLGPGVPPIPTERCADVRRSVLTAGLATLATGLAAGPAQAASDLRLPFACGAGVVGKYYTGHQPPLAIDFNGPGGGDSDLGMKVVAAGPGVVTKSLYYDKASNVGYGNAIEIRHPSGVYTFYAHLRDRLVKVGDHVSRGQLIGHVGKTSAKYHFSAHLHYEQRTASGAVAQALFHGVVAPEYSHKDYAVAHRSDNCPKRATAPAPAPAPAPNPASAGVVLPPIQARRAATVRTDRGEPVAARMGARTGAALVRSYRGGDRVRIVCQKRGEQVTGKFGTSRLWDLVDLGNGRGAYVTDTYVYTGSDGRVAPDCPA
ncbi:peptidoglycan DD-metalloendopeptidase family protein [Paraconexibacter antarcticus]|uniref:Peptidoglycan DD-metalloendopeptidase family protein n=1 Tax=Paraconexibacter antarcticus TaxID=2949664 RepID=A0ABY5DQ09_9ACTN|nr:peptidoglycan DD-metalloendopeptidase family protein [Paraconexibacter antarcticus]UTI62664.1 peptidoglycan DD-metalloendopeptidase family protein [Paraconexibacter antarcticus]